MYIVFLENAKIGAPLKNTEYAVLVCDKCFDRQVDNCSCKGRVKRIATGISRIVIKAALHENNWIMTQKVNVLN